MIRKLLGHLLFMTFLCDRRKDISFFQVGEIMEKICQMSDVKGQKSNVNFITF